MGDPIARREYSRYVARIVGVELSTVEEALGRVRRSPGAAPTEQPSPLDRAESELLRVILANAPGVGEVSVSDFTDARLAAAYEAVASTVSDTPSGTAVDVSTVRDQDARSLLLSLSMNETPLPEWSDVWARVRGKRIDVEIDELEERLSDLEEGTELHSENLRALIALQQEKRSLGGT